MDLEIEKRTFGHFLCNALLRFLFKVFTFLICLAESLGFTNDPKVRIYSNEEIDDGTQWILSIELENHLKIKTALCKMHFLKMVKNTFFNFQLH